jgi:hypothetical protein
MDAIVKPMMNTDGKAMERWDLLQEIGDPKKAAHAKGTFPEGAPTMSNSQYTRSAGRS